MRKIVLLSIVSFVCVLLIMPAQARVSKKSYKKALKKVTRKEAVYQRDDFHANIVWAATHQTPEYLQSKTDYIAKIYDLTPQEKQEILDKQNKAFAQQVSFFVSFYSYDRNTTNLSVKDNKWKLYLHTGAQKIEPSSIRVKEKLTPIEKVLFPYVDHWSKAYYVTFPIESLQVPFTLEIRSPEGNSELRWKK